MWARCIGCLVKWLCALYCAGFVAWVAYVLAYTAARYPGTAREVLASVPIAWLLFMWSLVGALAVPWVHQHKRLHLRRCPRGYRLSVWAGWSICMLLLTLWAWSAWWSFFLAPASQPVRSFQLHCGCLEYSVFPSARPAGSPRWHVSDCSYGPVIWWRPILQRGNAPPMLWLRVPLWIPLLIVALVTASLHWRARRFPLDHCQNCGYDLTGNVSGRCPECGTPVPGTFAEGESA